MELDVIITNGMILDGTGQPAYRADLGIRGGGIAVIGRLDGEKAGRVIDARGLMVCPGIIDAHCHTDMYAAQVTDADGKILQGVTTDICGLCGDSPAPIGSGHLEEYEARQSYRLPGAGLIRPVGYSEYADQVMAAGNATNMALFVGNTNLRVNAVGYEKRSAARDEMDRMKGMLREALEEGAYGLSTGLTYVPSGFSDTEELIELCRVMEPYGGLYNSHMRDEGDGVLEAVREVIRIAQASGCKAHISHLKVLGKKNHGLSSQCLELIHGANERGVSLTFDVYPYTAGSCSLKTLLPPGVLELGIEDDWKAMTEPQVYERIQRGLEKDGWDNMLLRYGAGCIVVSSAGDPQYEGRTVEEIAAAMGAKPIDAVLRVLGDTKGQASMIYHALSEEDLLTFMKDPLCMIGTDAFARKYQGPTAAGKPHPRNYGAFPRMIREYLLEKKALSLETGIARMTSLPAKRFGLGSRGELKPGYTADLLVFDPETIRETGTYQNPAVKPQGVRWVMIGGEIAVDDGVYLGKKAGRVLKRGIDQPKEL